MNGIFQLIRSVLVSIKGALIANPEVQKLVKNHPEFFDFLKRRLHWRDFTGLPLTFTIMVFCYFLFLFLGIITKILISAPIVYLDINLTNLFYTYRNPLLTQILHWITLLANWEMVLSGAIVFCVILWLWKRKTYIIPFLLSLGLASFLSYIGKVIIQRPRPQQVAVYDISSFSFPSSHATIGLAFYGFIAYFLIRNTKNLKYKALVIFYSVVLILAIGFSRIYLGFHFLSDVNGGYLLGALTLIIGISLTEWILYKNKNLKLQATPAIKLLTVILIFLQLSFYAGFGLFYNLPLEITRDHIITQINKDNIQGIFALPYEMPQYTKTPTAVRQEPISFIIIAKDDASLINIFEQAGWSLADSPTVSAIWKLAKAAISNQEYLDAPVTPSFWNGTVNSFGFEKPTVSATVRQRHHCRFWRTDFVTENGAQVYVGTASFDKGLKWLITHEIDPDIDKEREFIFTDLTKTGLIASDSKINITTPEVSKNFSGSLFFTDGQAYIIYLK